MTADPAPTTPARDAFVGRTIRGTYRILQVLDHGGMGMVFIAEHVRLKRKVALKVLAAHLAADADALDRFHAEAETVSQLHHPNIVNITDFDTTEEGEPYIVMELLFGESLADRLDRDRSLPLAEVVRLSSQVAAGLDTAHRAGIVHRDLKPANIFLINMHGQASYVKLLDFGISKRAGAGRKITREFDILGTPDYMAPEQARGQTKNVDHRADQYSLAAIAYEMLCGVVPFPGDDVMTVLQKVITEAPPALSERVPQLPAGVEPVLFRALSKQPDHRYESILEFVNQLEMAAQPVSLSAPSIATSTGPASAESAPPESRQVISASPHSRRESETAKTELAQRESVMAGAAAAAAANMEPAAASAEPSPRAPAASDPFLEGDRPSDAGRMTPTAASARRRRFSTSPSVDAAGEVSQQIDQARQALGFEDVELAARHAEGALSVAERAKQPEIDALIEGASTLFSLVFERKLGGVRRRLAVRDTPKTDTRDRLSPEQVFLLTRLDAATTVDEALDLSPLPRLQTLRLLVGLLQRRLIEVR